MQLTVRFRNWITEIIAAMLVLLFLYTAINKIRSQDSFKDAMAQNAVLAAYTGTLSWLIPMTEIIIAGLLIIPRFRRYGLLGAFLLMTLFTSYVAYMLTMAGDLPCTCGGVIQQMSWKQHLWFNTAFTILALAAFFSYPKRFAHGKQEKPNTCIT
ncbi:MAG TPA: MauE/DoxX family redox-associated membrane protein [Chitinophagaceae bacterium]|nr:MauE/DoxX family redox-associated membrane protein [Chitinophagaceae bacterium]